MREVSERFSENLKRERERAGISQETLAILTSLHRTQISMLERGIRCPRIDTLVKLADSLEVTPNELLAGISWKPAVPRLGGFSAEPPPGS